jgi:pimeloyl-ACP methyl ester carboxylesterase|tara:strand:- start:226922 stop:227977 length:1056 start_codon:yes stop_codon:yes gene_type:complete
MSQKGLIEHRIECADVALRAVAKGQGPLVLMLHGFPGLAWSWRHQMAPIAEAGWRAVAIDFLGYGGSDRPLDPRAYAADRIHQYLHAILDYFGAENAVIIGQDFGAQYAWNFAVRSPERTQALVATIPYDFDLAGRALLGRKETAAPDAPAAPLVASPDHLPSERFAAMAAEHFIHFHYFQRVGPADRELGAAVPEFLRRIFHALSAGGDLWSWKQKPMGGTGYLDVLPPAPPFPWQWLSEEEFATFVAGYDHVDPMRRMIGGLNSYRTADINWQMGREWADANVDVPTLFLYGADDPSFSFFQDWEPRMRRRVPGLRDMIAIPGAGHFVQQERPEAFNAALLGFLETLAT